MARVGRAAQALLSHLMERAGPRKDRYHNPITPPGEYYCWPPVRELSAKMGYNDPAGRQIYILLKQLYEAGLIERIDAGGGRRNNVYRLRCMEESEREWMEQKAEQAQQAEQHQADDDALENAVIGDRAAPTIPTGQPRSEHRGTPVETFALSEAFNQKIKPTNSHNTPQSGGEDVVGVVVGMLTARRLEIQTARKLAANQDPDYVRYVCKLSDGASIENPPGFIRAALKPGAEPLDGFDEFKSEQQQERSARARAGKIIDQATDDEIIEADPSRSAAVLLRPNYDGEDPHEASSIGRAVLKDTSSIGDLIILTSAIEKNRKRRADAEKLRLAQQDAQRREQHAPNTVVLRASTRNHADDERQRLEREQAEKAAAQQQAEKLAGEAEARKRLAEQFRHRQEIGKRAMRVADVLRDLKARTDEHDRHDYTERLELIVRAWPRAVGGQSVVDCEAIAREKVISDDLSADTDPWVLFDLLHQAAQGKLAASVEKGRMVSQTVGA